MDFSNLYELGKRLSMEIDCPVRHPPHNPEETLICHCGIRFPISSLNGDWEAVKRKHTKGHQTSENSPK